MEGLGPVPVPRQGEAGRQRVSITPLPPPQLAWGWGEGSPRRGLHPQGMCAGWTPMGLGGTVLQWSGAGTPLLGGHPRARHPAAGGHPGLAVVPAAHSERDPQSLGWGRHPTPAGGSPKPGVGPASHSWGRTPRPGAGQGPHSWGRSPGPKMGPTPRCGAGGTRNPGWAQHPAPGGSPGRGPHPAGWHPRGAAGQHGAGAAGLPGAGGAGGGSPGRVREVGGPVPGGLTQQQQLHLPRRLLAVLPQVLVDHAGALGGRLVLGAHGAAHGGGGGGCLRAPAALPCPARPGPPRPCARPRGGARAEGAGIRGRGHGGGGGASPLTCGGRPHAAAAGTGR